MWETIPPQYTASGIDRRHMSRASDIAEVDEPSMASLVSRSEQEANAALDDDNVSTNKFIS